MIIFVRDLSVLEKSANPATLEGIPIEVSPYLPDHIVLLSSDTHFFCLNLADPEKSWGAVNPERKFS